MFRSVVIEKTTYAASHRHEAAARMAPIATNGNRYRSWTRVGRMKNATARTARPVRIVSGVGRQATTAQTITNAARSSAAPTTTAENGPIVTASVHKALPACGWRMIASHAQVPFAATPLPCTEASAHGLYALTLAYGYSLAVLNISYSSP